MNPLIAFASVIMWFVMFAVWLDPSSGTFAMFSTLAAAIALSIYNGIPR